MTSDHLMGIWFPEGFCDASCGGINVALDILTACTSPGVPAGCTPAPLGTLLDTYGNYPQGHAERGNAEPDDATRAGRRRYAPRTEPMGIMSGLRIGHQADDTTGTAGFTILDGVAIPSELDDELICDSFAMNDAAPAPGTMFARMVHHLADLLLPEKAAATRMMLGGLGIGGSTRTFSPFGIVNTTLGATGGTRRHHETVLAGKSGRTGRGSRARHGCRRQPGGHGRFQTDDRSARRVREDRPWNRDSGCDRHVQHARPGDCTVQRDAFQRLRVRWCGRRADSDRSHHRCQRIRRARLRELRHDCGIQEPPGHCRSVDRAGSGWRRDHRGDRHRRATRPVVLPGPRPRSTGWSRPSRATPTISRSNRSRPRPRRDPRSTRSRCSRCATASTTSYSRPVLW